MTIVNEKAEKFIKKHKKLKIVNEEL